MSSACRRVDTTPRSAAKIGCIGSMPRRTPTSRAYGTSASIAVGRSRARGRRGRGRRREARPAPAPGVAHRAPPPRRSRAGCRRARAARSAGSAAVKKPPRQSDETRSPASAHHAAAFVEADLGDGLAPHPDRGQPGGDAAVDRLAQRPRVDGLLVEGEPGQPRVTGRGVASRPGAARDVEGCGDGHATRRRSSQTRAGGPRAPGRAAAGRRSPGRTRRPRCTDAARRLQPADHREARLVAGEPGQEGDAGLVVEGRRLEDVTRQRQRRRHLGVVRRQVALVECRQGGRRGRGDGRERTEQRVGVVPCRRPGSAPGS